MGIYIEVPRNHQKARQLVDLYGATRIPEPDRFEDVPPDVSLICVVENPVFDAAAVTYDADEFRGFKYDSSGRPRTWLILHKDLVRMMVPPAFKRLIV